MKTEKGAWNPYLAGGLSGLLGVVSVALAGKFLGASTTFVRAAGMVERIFVPETVANMAYYTAKGVRFDWQFLFVFGIFLGSLIASLASRTFVWKPVPEMWKDRHGSGVAKRGVVAFVGGIVAMYGARLAGGCPSGHGLSGLTQLSVSGFIAAACFFGGGILMASIVYPRTKK
ncbi:YeeE/YedE thiosulfate transporter family protein [Desulfoplanes sp.]